MIDYFHFIRPAWLLALLPLVALVWYMLKEKQSSRSWKAVVDPDLLPHLLSGENSIRSNRYLYLIAIVGLVSIIALAGPVWNKLPQPTFKQQSALVIALDLSRSMDAGDIKPNRLTRARHKIADVLKLREEGQTALVVYAADAFSVVPLTDNTATINALLPGLTTDMMPKQGSRADKALAQAYSLFENTGVLRGDILLVSDGLSSAEAAAVEALLKGNPAFRLSILGVGSEAGGPIPIADGGYLKDAQGSIVIAGLATDQMRTVASKGGGIFRIITANDDDVTSLLKILERNPFEQDVIASERVADVWQEQGPWLILFLLPLVALAFRRGVVFVVPLLASTVLLTVAPDAQAFRWNDLWQNNNQQGQHQFSQGQHEKAAELFDSADWKGSSFYRSGDYQNALEQWQVIDSEAGNYNRGNAHAKLGQLEDALKAYDQVLEKNPQHKDAIHNRKLVEDALKQQQNEDQQQGEQSKDSESDQKSDEESDSDNKEQSSESGGNGESEKSDENQQSNQSDQEPSDETQSQSQQAESESSESESEDESQQSQVSLEQKLSEQAADQWLRKIPDDPGGLLRRKFLYQYKNRGESTKEVNPW